MSLKYIFLLFILSSCVVPQQAGMCQLQERKMRKITIMLKKKDEQLQLLQQQLAPAKNQVVCLVEDGTNEETCVELTSK